MPTPPHPLLMLVSGPSGSGKTTVCARLCAEFPAIRRCITCTTRPPRTGEVDGEDYHFLSQDEFLSRKADGGFLESAIVHGNHYGTAKSEVQGHLAAGRDLVLNLDVQGAETFRRLSEADVVLRRALVTVFILPPPLESLRRRLTNRATDSQEVIEARIATALEEVKYRDKYDYNFVSGSPDEDFNRLRSIYLKEKTHDSQAGRSRR